VNKIVTGALVIAFLGFVAFAAAAEEAAAGKPVLDTEPARISYSIGVQVGSSLRECGMTLDPNLILRGLQDTMSGAEPAMSREEISEAMGTFQQHMMQQQREKAEKAQEEGASFLEENAKKEGVVTLPSGLQYKVIREGEGRIPKATDTVKTNYRGTLINGKQFDSSYDRGEPAEFPVTGVIKGWQEALQLMKEGAKWQLFVPSELGYGQMGSRGSIPPNATLIFEIELLEIVESTSVEIPSQQ